MRVSIRLKYIFAVLLCIISITLVGLHRVSQLEKQAFEHEVQRRAAVVSEFGTATQTYVEEQLRAATESETDALILEAMSAPFVTRNIFDAFNEKMPEYVYKQPTLNPLNLANQADQFETDIIKRFQNNPALEELTGYRYQEDIEKFYVAHPIHVEASCLECHGRPEDAPMEIVDRYGTEHGYHWNVGEIVSALMIYVPTVDLRANQVALQRASFGTLVLLMIVLVAALLILFEKLINRRIVALGSALEQRALNPDSSMRLHDKSRDELGLLARQFNYMADTLARAYQNLEDKVAERTHELTQTLQALKRTQSRLIHTEKMSSLGQMVGGVAHEINNPANFIHGNLRYTQEYTQTLIHLIKRLMSQIPPEQLSEDLQEDLEATDLPFLESDLQKIIKSMQAGTERIRNIVLSLRNFARLDEADLKTVDLHDGIESTLLVLQNRLNSETSEPIITFTKDYGELPAVECYPVQLNQVIFHLLNNAIDAVENLTDRQPTIVIKTDQIEAGCRICITDNGVGIDEDVRKSIFDPFFTTKPIGQGTGLGLAISHQIIVETHGGELICQSTPGQGTSMIVVIPRAVNLVEK